MAGLTSRAAELLTTEDGRELYRLLAALGLLKTSESKINQPLSFSIGPYKSDGMGKFVHDPSLGFNKFFWSECEELLAAKRGKRCVLLGESVARGYFFDPIQNPARMLAEQLEATAGQIVDVVDLAVTSATLTDLLELLDKIHLLNPDVVVVWAGNNWLTSIQFWLMPELVLHDANQCKSYSRLSNFVKEEMQLNFQIFKKKLQELTEAGTQVVVVIPAVNRETWEHDSLYRQSCQFLSEEIKDSDELTEFKPKCPGCTKQVQELLRSISDPQIAIVDLPRLFAASEFANQPNKIFLDYCHHTWEGLVFAVNAITQAILDLQDIPSPQQPYEFKISETHKGIAYTLAAIHADGFCQDMTYVRDLLQSAMHLWPNASNIVSSYLEMSLCASKLGWLRLRENLLHIGGEQTIRYFGVCESFQSFRPIMRRAAQEIFSDGNHKWLLPDSLRSFSLKRGISLSLLDRPYCSFHGRALHELEQTIFLRSTAYAEPFLLVVDDPAVITLTIVYRSRSLRGPRIYFDNQFIEELPASVEWITTMMQIPYAFSGMHELYIMWEVVEADPAMELKHFFEVVLFGGSEAYATALPTNGEICVLEAAITK